MKTKQVLTLLLAVVMVASLAAVPVSADADEWEATAAAASMTTDVTGVVRAPTIIMSIPTHVTVIVNPYKLTVTLPDATPDSTGEVTDAQIIMNDQYIVNLSDANVNVSIKATGNVAEGAEALRNFAPAPILDNVTVKQYYLYLEAVPIVGSTDGNLDATRSSIKWPTVNWVGKFTTLANELGKAKQVRFAASGQQLLMNDVGILEAADWTTAGATAGEASPAEASYGAISPSQYGWIAFKLFGNCTGAPTSPWKAADKLTVDLAYTFKFTGAKATMDPANT